MTVMENIESPTASHAQDVRSDQGPPKLKHFYQHRYEANVKSEKHLQLHKAADRLDAGRPICPAATSVYVVR